MQHLVEAVGQRNQLGGQLVDAVVRVGAPEGDADEHLDKLVEHELHVHLVVARRLRLGRTLGRLLGERLGRALALVRIHLRRHLRLALEVGSIVVERVGLLEHVRHHWETWTDGVGGEEGRSVRGALKRPEKGGVSKMRARGRS